MPKTFAEMLDAAKDGEEFGALINQLFVAAAQNMKDESDDQD
jgi:hypothetical protein